MASTKDWFEAMAAKDIEAVMATVHEDVLMIQNEQVLDRSDLQEGWVKSMSGDDWIMSDWNLKYEDEHSVAIDFKSVEGGVHLQLRMTMLLKDGQVYRGIIIAEPI